MPRRVLSRRAGYTPALGFLNFCRPSVWGNAAHVPPPAIGKSERCSRRTLTLRDVPAGSTLFKFTQEQIMNEPLYPKMTSNQKRIMIELRDQQVMTRDELATVLGITVKDVSNEIDGLVLRAAIRAQDRDTFELGAQAGRWMPRG